jgi:sugar/nucleoside kinase (ribokinase family)
LSIDLEDGDLRPFDVCVVAHVTRDVIRSGGARRSGPGGVAYYASLALHRLGRRVAVVTKMAREDRGELLSELHSEGITVFCSESAQTTVFNNEYREGDPDSRVQRVTSVAIPFAPSDLRTVDAGWFYLGPLLSQDMSATFVESVQKRGKIVLDAQGLVRNIEGEKIQAVRPAETEALMRPVSLLKVDAHEAATLSGADGSEDAARRLHALGAKEVIVTFASEGSMIFDGQEFQYIDAIPGKEVDATGCGDTYLAAYLDRRLAFNDPELSGRFAAAAATLALEREGAFRAGAPEVRARMA